MLKAEKFKSAAKHFASNPEDTQYFVTDDGQCFVVENDAANHASQFKEKELVRVRRDEVTKLVASFIELNEKTVSTQKLSAISDARTIHQLNIIKIDEQDSDEVKNAFEQKFEQLNK